MLMTSKADFTEEEWTRLKRAPFVAGMAISLADPGGPIELVKETAATLKAVLHEAEGGGRGELVDAIAREATEGARQRKSPLAGFKPSKGATAGVEILDELGEVNRIVSQKATPAEAAAFRDWLLAAAQEAANAAKEGGFLGFHAERVSDGEQRMLDRLSEVLAVPSA
jgi:broad specificity phosphatase PhoE